jgi:hypothetical protein
MIVFNGTKRANRTKNHRQKQNSDEVRQVFSHKKRISFSELAWQHLQQHGQSRDFYHTKNRHGARLPASP